MEEEIVDANLRLNQAVIVLCDTINTMIVSIPDLVL